MFCNLNIKIRFFKQYLFRFCIEYFADRLSDEVFPPEKVMAEVVYVNDSEETPRRVQFKMSDVPESNKLDKFVEDVRLVITGCFNAEVGDNLKKIV